MLSRLYTDYAMVLVLVALAGLFSALTWTKHSERGAPAGASLAEDIVRQTPTGRALIVIQPIEDDAAFADALQERLRPHNWTTVVVSGQPADARAALEKLNKAGERVDAIACTAVTANWGVFEDLAASYPRIGSPEIIVPRSHAWPTFLTVGNLLNIAHQISILAIVAIGMTLVIIAGGIDLSVGSLMAFAAVLGTWFIREYAGAEDATPLGMGVCFVVAIAACAAIGFAVGVLITFSDMPSFIATLGVMMIASGLAFVLADSQSINQVPASIDWLGRGTLFGIHIVTLLMLALYGAAHLLMTRTVLGRYIYAVGGNREAARLSGVPVARVVWFVFTVSAALAGLGGMIQASLHRSGAATYGKDYELYAIAAVVIGGTSLRGGEGKVFGTLVGAFIIGIIQNGMNMMRVIDVNSHWQKVVFGGIMLAAVLLDCLRKRSR